MYIRHKQFAALLLLFGLLLTASCARDYEDDILAAQQDMDDLVQADKDLRAYLTQSINEARTRLNQMLNSEDATLQGEISLKMNNLKSDIQGRMATILGRMNNEFANSEQRAADKIVALNALLNDAGGVKDRLQNKLNQTRQAVLDAQTAHNDQLAADLEHYYSKLQSLQNSLNNLTTTINSLRSQLDAFSSMDETARLQTIEDKISALEQFSLDVELENLGVALHLFTEQQYAEMTTEDLQKLNDFYADLENYSNKVLTQFSDFEDDLSQYEQTYNNLESDFDNVSSELQGLSTTFDALDDVLSEEQTLNYIQDCIDEIEGYESQILQIVGDLESCTSDLQNAESDAHDADSELEDRDTYLHVCEAWVAGIEERRDALNDWIADLQSRYPWWDW